MEDTDTDRCGLVNDQDDRSATSFAADVTNRLDMTYTLVYIDQGGRLTDKQVAALVRDDWESLNDSVDEWASGQRYNNAREILRDLTTTIQYEWERDDDENYDEMRGAYLDSEQAEEAIREIEDRDVSDPVRDLARATPGVVLRVMVPDMGEDDGWSFEEITPAAFLDRLGFEHTDGNLTLAGDIIGNASPEFSVCMGMALAGVSDLTTIMDLPGDGQVDIVNPYVWFGSPFTGSGWVEGPFTGTVRVNRTDLCTDDDAFGYSWDSVVGGYSASDYEAAVVAVVAVVVTDDTDDEKGS